MCRRESAGRLQHLRGVIAAVPGLRVVIVLAMIGFPFQLAHAQGSGIPHLEKHGATTQLVVDGKPYLILGAELLNSSSSSLDYMRPIWPRLASIPLNTVLTPLSWELIEPREGQFDFTLPDGLIRDARRNNLRLVFLWLASWKNGMSSYAPLWVKQDTRRFPRVIEKDGAPGGNPEHIGQGIDRSRCARFRRLDAPPPRSGW